jgi:hypothetical protein
MRHDLIFRAKGVDGRPHYIAREDDSGVWKVVDLSYCPCSFGQIATNGAMLAFRLEHLRTALEVTELLQELCRYPTSVELVRS